MASSHFLATLCLVMTSLQPLTSGQIFDGIDLENVGMQGLTVSPNDYLRLWDSKRSSSQLSDVYANGIPGDVVDLLGPGWRRGREPLDGFHTIPANIGEQDRASQLSFGKRDPGTLARILKTFNQLNQTIHYGRKKKDTFESRFYTIGATNGDNDRASQLSFGKRDPNLPRRIEETSPYLIKANKVGRKKKDTFDSTFHTIGENIGNQDRASQLSLGKRDPNLPIRIAKTSGYLCKLLNVGRKKKDSREDQARACQWIETPDKRDPNMAARIEKTSRGVQMALKQGRKKKDTFQSKFDTDEDNKQGAGVWLSAKEGSQNGDLDRLKSLKYNLDRTPSLRDNLDRTPDFILISREADDAVLGALFRRARPPLGLTN